MHLAAFEWALRYQEIRNEKCARKQRNTLKKTLSRRASIIYTASAHQSGYGISAEQTAFEIAKKNFNIFAKKKKIFMRLDWNVGGFFSSLQQAAMNASD